MNNKKLFKKALSMALRYNCNDLDKVFRRYSWRGIIFMQYINIYLCCYGRSVGYVKDLDKIVPEDMKDEFIDFIKWLKEHRHLCQYDQFFYLPLRNSALGFSPRPSKDNIAYMSLLRGNDTYKCPYSYSEIKSFFQKLHDEITAPLSNVAVTTIQEMQQSHKSLDLETCLRLTIFYLRHSTFMIGVLSDKDITANIVDIERRYLYYLIKDDPYMKIDNVHNIFYNTRLRELYGFPAVPMEYEIKDVISNYNSRVDFMNYIF